MRNNKFNACQEFFMRKFVNAKLKIRKKLDKKQEIRLEKERGESGTCQPLKKAKIEPPDEDFLKNL